MEISVPTDADGFLSQECPSCDQQFKVVFGEGSDEPISFCPYCGYEARDCWLTQEQLDHMQAGAANVILGPELKKLERQFKGASSELFKIDVKSSIPDVPAPPIDTDGDFEIFRFPCCNETVKADRHDKLFCIICGKEMDLKMSDAKKVFLSHKAVDKEMVVDFKTTLEILGYAPWIDEDAMPAGTPLERGLLQGMQDSCGVVFFITPSFKDEGYLETEVNYAIQEKRKKGDRFAIIILQFVDDDGNEGEIPELLQTYVRKNPKTHLQALREIVRALPLVASDVDWREGIEGVVLAPKIKSTTTELSDEAKSILTAAVSEDGTIIHVKYAGGQQIQTGGIALIPDNNARTVALWVGGLEDLGRRRFIKDVGYEGKMFEVTREGYQAADEIANT